MKNKKVFIILVNYNSCVDTFECIKSISKCNYENYEICVVDNGSTDDSFTRLRQEYGKRDGIYLINSSNNIGFGGV